MQLLMLCKALCLRVAKISHPFLPIKLTTVLILVLSMQVTARSFAQRISLSEKSISLPRLFDIIHRQTGYTFVYEKKIFENTPVISVDKKDALLTDVLNIVLKEQHLVYEIKYNTIIITREETTVPLQGKSNLRTTQQEPVTGKVTDKKGAALPGVSVKIKGTGTGTSTDTDGKFRIVIPDKNAVIVFSFVGFVPVERTAGTQTEINVSMAEDSVKMGEVVVTALGIKRETKTLTYNVQEIKSSEVTAIKDASFINSLAGKVAGVTINNSSSGIGGSTRVVMRGTKSLFGSNDALYVLDGIPLPSLKTTQPEDFYKVPDGGDNDGISHINPDDIESISVLTGSAAAALYGSQGANGAILITTKQGTPGKLQVTYSNNSMFIRPLVTPRFQTTYGSEEGSYQSWGNKLEMPSTYDPTDFFQTGYNETNSLGLSAGTEKSRTYGSVSAVNSRGVVPNNDYNRYNASFRNTSTLIDNKLFLDLNSFYMSQDDQNMRGQGQYHNPLLPIYLFPRGDDIERYKLFQRYDAERNFNTQYWPYGNMGLGIQNPYWINNKSLFNNDRQRYMLGGSLKYTILPWMQLTGRVRIDNTQTGYTKKFYASSDELFASENGFFMEQKTSSRQTYADAILNIDKAVNDNFRIVANLGSSLVDSKYKLSSYEGNLLTVPDFFHYSNINRSDADKTKNIQDGYHDQIQALFATAQVGFKNLLFLDLTGRNDWPSMLSGTSKSSYFYPSAGLSAVISDMADLSPSGISFLKARVSYSEAGNPPQRWIANESTYSVVNGQLNTSTFPPATFLEPELTKSLEAGLNVKFLMGKINLDATWYTSDTYNQLFRFTPPPSTGYASMYLNAGQVNNYGIEAALGLKQNIGPLLWNASLKYTFNRNKIKELIPPGTMIGGIPVSTDRITVSQALNHAYEMVLTTGGTMSDIYVKGFAVDSKGNILISPTTGEIKASDVPIKAGKAAPDYNAGFSNSFSFKGFDLSFLLDARVGGIVVSATQSYLDGFGVSQESADNRDAGYVLIDGTAKINVRNYYNVAGGGQILAPYVYSATNVRLRELSLGYTFPAKFFHKKINGLSLSMTARNLWMIYNKAPFDPELTASTGTYYQGFDYFMMPGLRNIGFGVKVLF